MLNYVATISESVRFYTESFAQKRILNPSENYAARVSESEMCRVTRAFWRFQLSYELAHPEDTTQLSSDNDSKVSQQWDRRYIFYENHTTVQRERQGWLTCSGHQSSYCLNEFLETLWGWEIDEIEVVRFHLRSEVNTFQYNGTTNGSTELSEQPSLLQILVRDLDYWRLDTNAPIDYVLVTNLGRIVGLLVMNVAHWYITIWPDIPYDLNIPNFFDVTLWSYIDYNQYNQQWGWRLWDQDRLKDRGLLRLDDYFNPADLVNLTDAERLCSKSFAELHCEEAQRACYEAQFREIDRAIKARCLQQVRQEIERAKHAW